MRNLLLLGLDYALRKNFAAPHRMQSVIFEGRHNVPKRLGRPCNTGMVHAQHLTGQPEHQVCDKGRDWSMPAFSERYKSSTQRMLEEVMVSGDELESCHHSVMMLTYNFPPDKCVTYLECMVYLYANLYTNTL